MDPRQQYQRSSSWGWTRIDMLLHIYNHAISALERGAELLESDADAGEIADVRLDAQKKILLIADGLAVEQGGTPVQVMQLCIFALDRVRSDSSQDWKDAARVLSNVREGFEQIQETAREMERTGQIPPLQTV